MSITPSPSEGQVWRDTDPRGPARHLLIVSMDAGFAYCEPVAQRVAGTRPSLNFYWDKIPGRKTRALLERFNGKRGGYEFIAEFAKKATQIP